MPRRKPDLNLLLCGRQRLTELVNGRARTLCRSRAAFLGDPALLLGQQRDGIGTRPCQRPLQLGASLVGLAGDQRPEPRLRTRELLVEAL